MYILKCTGNRLYTGSTKDLDRRLKQHFNGEGANYTKKYPPIELVYVEQFDRIDYAFNREKQVQRWSRKKKDALIENNEEELAKLSKCYKYHKR